MVTRSKPAAELRGASSAAIAHETMTLWRSGVAVTAAAAVPAAPIILRRLILDFVKLSFTGLTSRAKKIISSGVRAHPFKLRQSFLVRRQPGQDVAKLSRGGRPVSCVKCGPGESAHDLHAAGRHARGGPQFFERGFLIGLEQ